MGPAAGLPPVIYPDSAQALLDVGSRAITRAAFPGTAIKALICSAQMVFWGWLNALRTPQCDLPVVVWQHPRQ